MVKIFAGIVRHLLTIYGGSTIAGGDEAIGQALKEFAESLASGDTNAIVAALVTVGAIVWSIYEKRKKNKDTVRLYHEGDGIIREKKV